MTARSPDRIARMLDLDLRAGRAGTEDGCAEHAARAQLRVQIAALEGQLSDAIIDAFPRTRADAVRRVPRVPCGPRVLSLGELEAVRDALASQVADVAGLRARNRELLERMHRDPARYRFAKISFSELGETGCGFWEVRPRLGLVGILMGWWRVKLSSGCPLARDR